MDTQELIIVEVFCETYQIEMTLFQDLEEFGLIETITQNNTKYIYENELSKIQKILRLQSDLNINNEGIEVVLELLNKIDNLHQEVRYLKNRLDLY
ncbi:chaperone modulator CbpM, partial [Flavobacterium sp. NRK F10]